MRTHVAEGRKLHAQLDPHGLACVGTPAEVLQVQCGRAHGEPSPGADVARVSPVPAQMWNG